MPRVPITDLGGSLNQGRSPAELELNEYVSLSNFYQFGGKLIRRGGTRRLTTTGTFVERITGLASYKPAVLPPGGVDMFVAGPTNFGIFVGSSVATLPQAGMTIPTSNRLWSLFQYKNIMYGIREGAPLVRSDGTYVGPAGIAAPTVAPTIADGAVGVIPAAAFKAVYTFYNANNGMESNPSPVSNTLVHGANLKIDWSGIAVSTNPQVTSRRIYRTLPDQSGEYFLVAEIPNNTATTYIGDNTLAQDLDVAVSQTNGVPPSGLTAGVVWKERLMVTDGTDLFHSEDGLIEAFDPDAIIPVFPDDGHKIRALCAYGDRLVIGKTNKIHYLVGSDPDTFQLLTLTDRHGCVSHHTMQTAEGYLFWLGLDNVYRSDGTNVTGIASVKLKSIIASMDTAAARDATATVFPELGWYLLAIPNYVTLMYNYRLDVWAVMTPAAGIGTIGDFFDTNFDQQIYVADTTTGNIYRFHDTTYGLDGSAFGEFPISASFVSRGFVTEAGTDFVVTHALLRSPTYNETVTLSIRNDTGVVKSRDVSLSYAKRWKTYNLSTRHQAQTQAYLSLAYIGQTAIELEGFALDIEPLGRSSMSAA